MESGDWCCYQVLLFLLLLLVANCVPDFQSSQATLADSVGGRLGEEEVVRETFIGWEENTSAKIILPLRDASAQKTQVTPRPSSVTRFGGVGEKDRGKASCLYTCVRDWVLHFSVPCTGGHQK